MDYYITLDLNIYGILVHYLFAQIKEKMIDEHLLGFALLFEFVKMLAEVFRGLG